MYKLTQLPVPTHAQLQRRRLKFIKNRLKTPTCFGLRPSSGSYNVLAKITIILTTLGCMLSVVIWQHVVFFFLYRVVLDERPSLRVLASAVDDESFTALARTRTLGRSSNTTRYKQHDMLPHHQA